MNITGLEVFLLTFLIVAVLVIIILEKLSVRHNRIAEIRKSINAAVNPIIHGIIKVVFLIALIVVQFNMDFQNAMVFGIVGGIGLGLMTYFFKPKTKRNKAIIISNNLKTLGIQFILITINWYLLWMESEPANLIFSILTVPIFFFAGLIFLKPTGKHEYLSVLVLFVFLLVNAIVAAITWDLSPGILNPVCGWVYAGFYFDHLIISQRLTCIILSIIPSLFLYFGILVRKKLWKRQEIEVTTSM